jgi:SAM-dependent methyltransferase
MPGVTHAAGYFDEWYAAMLDTPDRDALKQRLLGLPPGLESTSLLTFDGLQEIRRRLEVGPDSVLLDLACGRGGYGIWLAGETGARVIGVDFSAVAVRQAAEAAAAAGLADRTEFRVGELEAIGLPDASVDAVLCVDAIQFAADVTAGATEVRRVLRPGGPAFVTCWEPVDPGDDRLMERIRRIDLAGQLTAGGLVDVVVENRTDWRAAERALWEAVVRLDPRGDPALTSLKEEGEQVLPTLDLTRRVLATGRRP